MAAQNEGADVTKAKAISRAIDILPVIREIQASGIISGSSVAAALN